jgi:crotonobetainyl-CoA:carnitine CoA-transferase CaiB-like acyl-CoA transferase
VAAAIALGLHARERKGIGEYLETTMLAATGYVQSNLVIQYPGRPDPAIPDKGQHGPHALYRLYPCARGWLFLAAVQEKEWAALAAALDRPEWPTDPRYSTHAARLAHEDLLVEALTEIFGTRPAADWRDHLLLHGVPAATADEQTFEEFLVANTPHHPMTHPEFGDYWRRPPVIRIEGCVQASPGPAPALGEHTEALLAELGYTQEECQDLIRSGAAGGSATGAGP